MEFGCTTNFRTYYLAGEFEGGDTDFSYIILTDDDQTTDSTVRVKQRRDWRLPLSFLTMDVDNDRMDRILRKFEAARDFVVMTFSVDAARSDNDFKTLIDVRGSTRAVREFRSKCAGPEAATDATEAVRNGQTTPRANDPRPVLPSKDVIETIAAAMLLKNAEDVELYANNEGTPLWQKSLIEILAEHLSSGTALDEEAHSPRILTRSTLSCNEPSSGWRETVLLLLSRSFRGNSRCRRPRARRSIHP